MSSVSWHWPLSNTESDKTDRHNTVLMRSLLLKSRVNETAYKAVSWSTKAITKSYVLYSNTALLCHQKQVTAWHLP